MSECGLGCYFALWKPAYKDCCSWTRAIRDLQLRKHYSGENWHCDVSHFRFHFIADSLCKTTGVGCRTSRLGGGGDEGHWIVHECSFGDPRLVLGRIALVNLVVPFGTYGCIGLSLACACDCYRPSSAQVPPECSVRAHSVSRNGRDGRAAPRRTAISEGNDYEFGRENIPPGAGGAGLYSQSRGLHAHDDDPSGRSHGGSHAQGSGPASGCRIGLTGGWTAVCWGRWISGSETESSSGRGLWGMRRSH